MNKEKKKKDPVVLLLDLIIIVLIYVMIVIGVNLFQDVNHEKKMGGLRQDASLMSYHLEKNDYASLIQGSYVNTFSNIDDTEMYHELANYAEAAFLYKIYVEKEKTAEADKQKDIMENSRESMGSLTVFADKVDKMINDFGKN